MKITHCDLRPATCCLIGCLLPIAYCLSGCGAAKSIVNNNIPAAENALGLDGSRLIVPINGSRAAISGSAGVAVTVRDRSFSQQNQLRKAKFEQYFADSVTVALPAGATAPADFTLSNMTFAVTISDGTVADLNYRQAAFSATYAGPVTYTRVGTTNQYTAQKLVGYSDVEISGDTFNKFRDILTGSPAPNTIISRLSLDTDDTKLPRGSTITFTFRGGKVRVAL